MTLLGFAFCRQTNVERTPIQKRCCAPRWKLYSFYV